MGHAIAVAIGAKLSQPDRKVVCITGDGCLMMHGTEISTAVCNNISTILLSSIMVDWIWLKRQCNIAMVK